MAAEKSFEIGGVKFTALRRQNPIPHWVVRTDENGVVFEPGAGGISTESVPRMQASINELLVRVSKNDVADFRRRFGLPVEAEQKAEAEVGEHTGGRISQLPEFCFVFAPDAEPGEYVRALRRGETGYSPTSYDEMDPDKAKSLVSFMNKRLGVSDLQVACMEAGSLFGFHVPAAYPRLVGDVPRRSEVSTERKILDDGSWCIETAENVTRLVVGGYLLRRSASAFMEPVGGYERRSDGRWQADVAQAWDAETQTDALILGTFETRNEAIQALWEGRNKAYMPVKSITDYAVQNSWVRAREVGFQKGDVIYGSMCEGKEFCGKVLHADEKLVVQSMGREGAVIHDTQAMSRKVDVGEVTTIKYNEFGRALIQDREVVGLGPDR